MKISYVSNPTKGKAVKTTDPRRQKLDRLFKRETGACRVVSMRQTGPTKFIANCWDRKCYPRLCYDNMGWWELDLE